MKSIVKLICASSIALGLSACSFTQGVAQVAYNTKAENDCESQLNQKGSIHSNLKSACNGTNYEPSKDSKANSWDKQSDWKEKSDLEKKARIKHLEK